MNKHILTLVFAGAFIAIGASMMTGCRKDKVIGGCDQTIFFSTQIEPLITNNCNFSGCHGNGSSAAGYNLESHASIAANANRILNVINHDNGVSPMPQGSPKLADSLIGQFSCWLQQGKQNN